MTVRPYAWLALVTIAATPSLRAQAVCLPADYVSNMVEQELAKQLSPDRLSALLYPQPPQPVNPRDVLRTTDERLCERGRRLYAAEVREREVDPTVRVHVWRIGTVLAVLDPDYQYVRGSSDRYVLLVDSAGRNLGVYAFTVPDYPW